MDNILTFEQFGLGKSLENRKKNSTRIGIGWQPSVRAKWISYVHILSAYLNFWHVVDGAVLSIAEQASSKNGEKLMWHNLCPKFGLRSWTLDIRFNLFWVKIEGTTQMCDTNSINTEESIFFIHAISLGVSDFLKELESRSSYFSV